MKPANRYILFRLALAFASGILITHTWPGMMQWNLPGLVLSLVLLSGFYFAAYGQRQRLGLELLTLVSLFLIGSLHLQASLYSCRPDVMQHQIRPQESQVIQCQVISIHKPGVYYQSYSVRAESIDRKQVVGRFLLRTRKADCLQLLPGQNLTLYGAFEKLLPGRNPGQFDSRTYWANKQIYYQLRIRSDQLLKIIDGPKGWSSKAYMLREDIIRKLRMTALGKDQLAITAAMLLGDRTEITSEMRSSFQEAGAMHLLAISGLHVGILFAIINFLSYPLRWLTNGKLLQSVIITISILGFAWITGFSASVSRASLLIILYIIVRWINRPVDSTHMLSLVLLALLVYKPMWIVDVGFQLSFSAVLSIIWLSPPLNKLIKTKWIFVRWIRSILMVSLAAQLGVLPLTLYYFHQFSGSFWLSSLLVLPLMGAVLLIGLLVIVLAILNMDQWWLTESYNELLGGILKLIEIIGAGGYWREDIPFSLKLCLISLLAGVSLTFWIYLKNSISRRLFLFLSLVLIITGWKDSLREATNNFYLLHQTGNTLIALGRQNQLTWTAPDSSLRLSNNQALRDLKRIGRFKEVNKQPFSYLSNWGGHRLLIIDSLGVYTPGLKQDWVLLTHNPKINLQRLIDSVQPSFIMADGSNWTSIARLWAATCHKNKLRFHYTGESGALVLSMD